jgi:hypothetical protein
MPEPTSIDHRELERKSRDTLAVYNPTDEDYTVYWDGFGFVIPRATKDNGHGPGIAYLPRYIAVNYLSQMTDKLIMDEVNRRVREENEDRIKKRKQNAMNHWEERLIFERSLMPDNEILRKQWLPTLFKGIVDQYGATTLPQQREGGRQRDLRPLDEQLLEEMDRTYTPPQPPSPERDHDAAVQEISL